MKRTIVLLILMAISVSGFDFYGYTFDTNGQALNATNVTIEMYFMVPNQGPTLNATFSALSNASGYFNVSGITDDAQGMYKPVLTHYSGADADYVGKSLPEFPYMMYAGISNVSFYLWPAATLNITIYGLNMSGQTADKNFEYQVKDTRVGFPVKYQFGSTISQATVNLPANRNYSLMVYGEEAFPFSYTINNLSDFSTPRHWDLRLNATDSYKWVSGYVTVNDSAGFDEIYIVGYIMESDGMVFPQAVPANISSWRSGTPSDTFNPTTGFYNMTMLASAQSSNVLLFATARNGSDYYGAFKNITLVGNTSEEFNFSLQPLAGGYVTNITISGNPTKYVQTKMVRFQFLNSTGSAVSSAFVSAAVNYSSQNQADFTWMQDVGSTDNGTASFTMLSGNVQMEIFTNDGAPKKTTIPASSLSQDPVNVTIPAFDPGGIDDTISGIFIDFLVSNSTCDVPEPPSGCSLMPQTDLSEFNPLSIVMGGGSMSFRMGKLTSGSTTGIMVHYVNADLIASGPPDALFDGSANSSTNASTFSEAWRFGSNGPSIYDRVLMGMPYSDSYLNDSANITLLVKKLFDENWNVIWNADENTTGQLPTEYGDFNQTLFDNSTHGPTCSTTDPSALCYVNTTTNMIWVQIPHFSGTGPDVDGDPPASVTEQIDLLLGWNLISIPLVIP